MFSNSVLGSTGHWPVPSGDPPDGTGKDKLPGVGSDSPCGRQTMPVGGSPTRTGGSPVPPILKTRPGRFHWSGSAVAPAEARGQRPIDEEGFADDIAGGKRPPRARVETVAGVVAHDYVGINHLTIAGHGIGHLKKPVGENGLLIRKIGCELDVRLRVDPVIVRDGVVQMAGELALARRLVGIEAIDIFEMRRAGVEPLAVDAQVPVIADLHMIAGEGDEPLDVKLILLHARMLNALGFKHGDFAELRFAEIER